MFLVNIFRLQLTVSNWNHRKWNLRYGGTPVLNSTLSVQKQPQTTRKGTDKAVFQNDFFMDAEIWISYYLHVLETTILLICYQLFKDIRAILNSQATQNRCWARRSLCDEVRWPLG